MPASRLRDDSGRPADPRSGNLRNLREQGLVETVRIPGHRDHAVVLTKCGRELLERHRDPDQGGRQTFYAGLKRARELEHDSQVYDAYLHVAGRLEEQGARIDRVVLDYELKRDYQKWLPRQYARFVGTAYGQNVNAFFDKLVSAGLAVRCGCVHNRARVYHVRHGSLYRAIGEPNSRNRKPIPAAGVTQRLMVLDAVVAHPQLAWLATVADKVAYFTMASSCPTAAFPHSNFGAGATGRVRLFPDALPIGVDTAGHAAFVFVVTSPDTDDLRGFLQRHADLVRRLRGWTIRLVLPPHLSMMNRRSRRWSAANSQRLFHR